MISPLYLDVMDMLCVSRSGCQQIVGRLLFGHSLLIARLYLKKSPIASYRFRLLLPYCSAFVAAPPWMTRMTLASLLPRDPSDAARSPSSCVPLASSCRVRRLLPPIADAGACACSTRRTRCPPGQAKLGAGGTGWWWCLRVPLLLDASCARVPPAPTLMARIDRRRRSPPLCCIYIYIYVKVS